MKFYKRYDNGRIRIGYLGSLYLEIGLHDSPWSNREVALFWKAYANKLFCFRY
jgi:hypothetical protein